MIVTPMYLLSAAGSSRDEVLCRVEIDNISDRGSRADYRVRLYARGDRRRLVKENHVINYPKKALPAWRLLSAAMHALENPDTPLDASHWR
jgi:hypothetical protein